MTADEIRAGAQVFQLAVVAVGLVLTINQIRIFSAQYRDLHEWNRRKAAQDAVQAFLNLAESNKLINQAFDYMQKNDPYAIERVNEECERTPELRVALTSLLNYFEMIAWGVRHSVYDEDLIRDSMASAMTLTCHRFGPYIAHKANHGQPDAWSEARACVAKWKREVEARATQLVRNPTGNGA